MPHVVEHGMTIASSQVVAHTTRQNGAMEKTKRRVAKIGQSLGSPFLGYQAGIHPYLRKCLTGGWQQNSMNLLGIVLGVKR
jgi:hypothetical protein